MKEPEAQRGSNLPKVTHSFGSGTKEDLGFEPGYALVVLGKLLDLSEPQLPHLQR